MAKYGVSYFLVQNDFFCRGPRGRVSHAIGFLYGCDRNNIKCKVVSGDNINNYLLENNLSEDVMAVELRGNNLLFHFKFLISLSFSLLDSGKIILRWKPFLPFLIFPFLIFSKKIFFEMNSLTGIDSKNVVVEKLTRLSLYLVCKLSKVICVSENALLEINKHTNNALADNDAVIMPNGYFSNNFECITDSVISSSNRKVSLIYFGTNQKYYDWWLLEKLYNAKDNLNFDLSIDIYGFSSSCVYANYHGKYSPNIICKELKKYENPVLIIHSSDSSVARSGSPMKLFEYASLGIPVITSSSLKRQVSQLNSFHIYDAGNYDSLVNCLDLISSNYQMLVLDSYKDSVFVKENYSWESIVKKTLS